jgi:hypothetical protein
MKQFLTHLLSLLFLLSPLSLLAQDLAPIKAELARLQQSIKDQPIANKDLSSAMADAIKATTDSINSGKVLLSLEKLSEAEEFFYGSQRLDDTAAVEKGGLPAFESEWGKVSLQLTALDKEAHARKWTNSPLAVRALAERAQGRAIPLLEGGRGFATATGPKEGLFYVGQAEGDAAFAKFCATLNLGSKPSGFALRSLLPELQRLQEKTNAAFQPPKSIDQHSRFIALNSEIKLAQELDGSKFYAGALYSYLEAVRHFGMLDAPPLDSAQQNAVKNDLSSLRKKLSASSHDDSVAELFLERAESYTAHPDGSATKPDEWRAARVILDQVLPAYYAAQKPAAPLQRASGKTVDITLVRWPYT